MCIGSDNDFDTIIQNSDNLVSTCICVLPRANSGFPANAFLLFLGGCPMTEELQMMWDTSWTNLIL